MLCPEDTERCFPSRTPDDREDQTDHRSRARLGMFGSWVKANVKGKDTVMCSIAQTSTRKFSPSLIHGNLCESKVRGFTMRLCCEATSL